MSITTAADIFDALREYRILDAAQLEKLSRAMKGRSLDTRSVAKELLEHDWATPYQVNLLLQGRGAELLLGEYLLLQRLGEGGMGQVFKARHLLMNRTVAIKIIRKERLAYPDAVERFHREIRLAAQLDHPHLVRALDAARVGDTHFLVMEYVEGADLQRLVQNAGPLPVGQACTYVCQAALGLQQVAERDLVHRDIKPSNLQVTADGTMVKILDLGLARLQTADGAGERASGLTRAYSVLGTPDYIAPEQIADPRQVDTRADIYSLGCTFYFLLAGRPPFPDGSWEQKLVCHGKVEPQPIEQVRSNVPPEVGAILRTMMAKWPEDRYSSPVDVAQALAPFCQLAGAVTPSASVTPDYPIAQPIGGFESAGTLQTGSTIAPLPAAPMRPSSQATVLVNVPAATPTSQQRPTQLVNIPPATPSPQTRPTQPVNIPPATPLPQPRPSGRKRFPLMLTGAGVGLVLLILILVLAWPKGSGDEQEGESKSAGPRILIDEDFSIAFANRRLPDGWEGDGFRVVKEKETEALCLESSKPSGHQKVQKKLPETLSGNFSIQGGYYLDEPQKLTITLENRSRSSLVAVGFDWDGKITIDNELNLAPPNYARLKHTHFLLKREGKMLRVYLDKELAVEKQLDDVLDFDTLRLGMIAGTGWHQRVARLYWLKVSTMGDDGAVPAPMQPPKQPSKGKASKKR